MEQLLIKGARSRRYSGAILQGLGAVVLFSLTIPMTKTALHTLSPEVVTSARALIAGLCALYCVWWNRWRLPRKQEWLWLVLGGAGVAVLFPYFLALSLVQVDAASMGVVLAGLPLTTTVVATVILRERHGLLFWLCSIGGAGLLVAYNSYSLVSPTTLVSHDTISLLALLTLVSAGIGYAAGARASTTLGGWQAICWMLVIYLPVSALFFGWAAGQDNAGGLPNAFIGFSLSTALSVAYLALVSQWFGFRYWYGAMTIAGAGVISQLQLLQPFFTLGFVVVLLGEPVAASHWGFALLIVFAVAGAMRQK